MNIAEFNQLYPEYAIDFTVPIGRQERIFDMQVLSSIPNELQPIGMFRQGRRGRPNYNQTKTHSQCNMCYRILRNDFFYRSTNGTRNSPWCKECQSKRSATLYEKNAEKITLKRYRTFAYFADHCAYCGFNDHPAAIDMHHLKDKSDGIAILITRVIYASAGQLREWAKKLIEESGKCIPLCANCHRMYHAGIIDVSHLQPQRYNLDDFLRYYNEHVSDNPQLAEFMY